jgi:hypothetical protein
MKKILLLFTIVCAGQLYGMDPTSLYELRRTGPIKPSVAKADRPDYLAMLPPEVKGLIVLAVARSGTLQETIEAIRGLIETNKEFNVMLNDPIIIRAIIHILVQKFNTPSEYIAQQLSTKGSEQYITLSKELMATLWQGEYFHYAENLINRGADIDFQTADTYPIQCGSNNEMNPIVIAGLSRLAAFLPQAIQTQQIIANIKSILFKKWPALIVHRKQPKFLEREAAEEFSIFKKMSNFMNLSQKEQKQILLTSKKDSQELLVHFEESLHTLQSNLQEIVQAVQETFPHDKQWKTLSEKMSKGKFQKAFDIVTRQSTTQYKGILVYTIGETDTCIIGANFSLVMYAIVSNQLTILKWLIEHQANLDLTMGTGDSALLIAMSLGKQQMVELLINNGAHINQKNALNEETHNKVLKIGKNFILNIGIENMYFDAPMHAVLHYYDPTLYSVLNLPELILMMRDGFMIPGGTPLFRLVMMRMDKQFNEEEFNVLLKLLLNKGANPNIQTKDGETALIALSVTEGHAQAMQLLLDHGADPTIKNSEGMTALDYVKSKGNENDPEREEKIELLEKAIKKQQQI